MNIFMYLIVGLMALLGGGSTIAIVGYMIVVLIKKIFNKIVHGASLYD